MNHRKADKIYIFSYILIFSVLIIQFPQNKSFGEQENRAKEILRQVDDMWRGSSSHSVLTMQVKTAHYTRNLKMEGWSKGKERTLVRILSPLKEKGTSTLKSGKNIYSYLPKTDRTIRLTSGMMMGSWMGSHFTNDDLVKESRMEEDYDATISFEGKRGDKDIIEFTLIPRPDAAVVWGKVVAVILSDGLIPIRYDYYDEDMKIAREMIFSRIENLAGRPLPKVMRVIPSEKPNEYTEIVYELLELDIPIDDDFFSISNLKSF